MELNKIEIVIKKYFDGETNIEEEQRLREYFTSAEVAPHLQQYSPIFVYFSHAATQKLEKEILVRPKFEDKKRAKVWLSIAASIVVLLGGMTYVYFDTQVASQDLGTYDNPEKAMKETQKALAMLSGHVNVGIKSVVGLEQYEDSKNLIFKQ